MVRELTCTIQFEGTNDGVVQQDSSAVRVEKMRMKALGLLNAVVTVGAMKIMGVYACLE